MHRFILPLTAAAVLATACSSPGPALTSSGGESAQSSTDVDRGRAAAPPTVAGGAIGKQWAAAPPMTIDPDKKYEATLKTAQGDIVISLLPKDAPIAVNSFVFLARQGYYENVPVHRIVKGFVIQSGDPTGTGTGGPGYTIKDEKVSLEYDRGTLAMARTPAPNSAGSQFFITLASLAGRLPKDYVIFGRVTKGMDVVDKIAATEVKRGPGGEVSSPTSPIAIDNIVIVES